MKKLSRFLGRGQAARKEKKGTHIAKLYVITLFVNSSSHRGQVGSLSSWSFPNVLCSMKSATAMGPGSTFSWDHLCELGSHTRVEGTGGMTCWEIILWGNVWENNTGFAQGLPLPWSRLTVSVQPCVVITWRLYEATIKQLAGLDLLLCFYVTVYISKHKISWLCKDACIFINWGKKIWIWLAAKVKIKILIVHALQLF